MNHQKKIRILVADDHPVTRDGIAGIIRSQRDMEVVGVAANGKEAIEMFSQHEPDIALMDLRMQVLDGVKATSTIVRDFLKARIIILTAYSGDDLIYHALKAGAKSYLIKTVSTKELVETIRAVHLGLRRIPSDVSGQLSDRIPHAEFTQREMEVLNLITHGKTNKEIAKELHIKERTVKFHVGEILIKLGVTDRAQAATMALRRGIIPFD